VVRAKAEWLVLMALGRPDGARTASEIAASPEARKIPAAMDRFPFQVAPTPTMTISGIVKSAMRNPTVSRVPTHVGKELENPPWPRKWIGRNRANM
jgi:hypothetical protein